MDTAIQRPLPVGVRLVGEDGNAFNVIGLISRRMREEGYGDLVAEFRAEAMAGDYGHLLATAMDWVEVE